MRHRAVLCAVVACVAGGVAAGPVAAAGLPSGRTSYRSLGDYTADMARLAAAQPGLVRRVVLPGRSIEGREITGVEIAQDVSAVDDGRPVALVVGLTHAREWPSGELALEYALDLVARRRDARVAGVLRRLRTIVVPVANPDGFVASQSGDPQRRRNCRAVAGDDPSAPCAERRGVDLNRNYGAYWGGPGASVSPLQDTYRGSGPWSEPETQAVHELSAGLPVTSVVSLHNVGGLVLRPPGFSALGTAPDEAGLRRLGDAMAAAAGYSSEFADQLYDATGALEDWNYAAQGAYGYTVELSDGDGDGAFHGAFASHVAAQWATAPGGGLREALLLAGEEAQDARDHAVVAGRAPAGVTLRLRRSFDTPTSPVCTTDLPGPGGGCAATTPARAIADGLAITLRVPRSGRFTWDVGPSTRPWVARDGGREAWTLECLSLSGAVASAVNVVVGRGQRADVDPCTTAPAVRVARNPRARALLVEDVVRSASRVRARVTCALSCTLTAVARDGRGRRVGRAGATLAPGTARTLRVALTAAGRRGRAIRLAVTGRDSLGEQLSVARRRVADPSR